jgi:SAM-dependent methyltransferase
MHPHEPAFARLRDLRLDSVLAGATSTALRPRFDRLAHRHANGSAPRAVSAFQLFQTPPALAARLVAALQLPPDARVLEPSAGLGRLLDALAPFAPRETVAVEFAPPCARELFHQDRPRVSILQRDFLALSPSETGLFDAVVMNPPFHLRADLRHILHARTFLKPGGSLAALCLLSSHRLAALRPLAASWEVLPAATFAAEGTHAVCVLLTLRG